MLEAMVEQGLIDKAQFSINLEPGMERMVLGSWVPRAKPAQITSFLQEEITEDIEWFDVKPYHVTSAGVPVYKYWQLDNRGCNFPFTSIQKIETNLKKLAPPKKLLSLFYKKKWF